MSTAARGPRRASAHGRRGADRGAGRRRCGGVARTLRAARPLAGGAALAALALPARTVWRGATIGAIPLAALAVATVALWSAAPVRSGQELSVDPRYRALVPLPYTPACADAPLPVCVHPAYRASLGETTEALNALIAPVLGLPGVPTRAEQGYRNVQGQYDQSGDTIWFDTGTQPTDTRRLLLLRSAAFGIILDSMRRSDACPAADRASCLRAQVVLGDWLLREAGGSDSETLGAPGDVAAIAPAVERFSALDPRVRRDWLAAHFADLRAGRVPLEDLP